VTVSRLLDERRELLMQRLDLILEMERQGEGSIVRFQLAELREEFLFIEKLYRAQLAELEERI
jgi:hypothetical protein